MNASADREGAKLDDDGKVILPAGFDSVEHRHRDVHDDHRRKELLRQSHRVAAGLRLTDHLDVVLQLQQSPKPFTHDRVVVGQQYGDRSHLPRLAAPVRGRVLRPSNGSCARIVVP